MPAFHKFNGKNKMNKSGSKEYADLELNKFQRYKQIWKSGTKPTIRPKPRIDAGHNLSLI